METVETSGKLTSHDPPPFGSDLAENKGGHPKHFGQGIPKIVNILTVSPTETPKKCQKISPAAGSSKSGPISENKGGHRLRGGHVLLIPLIQIP